MSENVLFEVRPSIAGPFSPAPSLRSQPPYFFMLLSISAAYLRMRVGALVRFDCGVRMRIGSACLVSFVFELFVLLP